MFAPNRFLRADDLNFLLYTQWVSHAAAVVLMPALWWLFAVPRAREAKQARAAFFDRLRDRAEIPGMLAVDVEDAGDPDANGRYWLVPAASGELARFEKLCETEAKLERIVHHAKRSQQSRLAHLAAKAHGAVKARNATKRQGGSYAIVLDACPESARGLTALADWNMWNLVAPAAAGTATGSGGGGSGGATSTPAVKYRCHGAVTMDLLAPVAGWVAEDADLAPAPTLTYPTEDEMDEELGSCEYYSRKIAALVCGAGKGKKKVSPSTAGAASPSSAAAAPEPKDEKKQAWVAS